MTTTLYNGDCLEVMKGIADKSINLILCDLPYGTTDSRWDNILDFQKLWYEYERIAKNDAAIVLFASGRFTNKLINSNESLYRYKWIWCKTKRGNFVNANNRPLTAYEEICVFSKGVTANGSKNKMCYYPQGIKKVHILQKDKSGTRFGSMCGKRPGHKQITVQEWENYPCDVLNFKSVADPEHPTQKPVALIEYLIKTYSQENDTILDNCMGSGTTGVACINTKRNFIGIEIDKTYFILAQKRIYHAESLFYLF